VGLGRTLGEGTAGFAVFDPARVSGQVLAGPLCAGSLQDPLKVSRDFQAFLKLKKIL